MTAAGLFVLRIVLATVLLAHGAHEMFGIFSTPAVGAGGLAATASRFSGAGLEPGLVMAALSATVQLAAGLFIAIGFATRWAAVSALISLGLVIWKVQLPWGFFANWTVEPSRGHGIEISFVLAGALACLALAGAGDWSIDGRRARNAAARASGRARLRRS